MQLVASVSRLSSLVIVSGQVTSSGVCGLGQGITRLRVSSATLDQAAVEALASLTQLNSLQLHFIEAEGKPAFKACVVPCINYSQYNPTWLRSETVSGGNSK